LADARSKESSPPRGSDRTQTITLEEGLAEKLHAWRRENGDRKYVFGTKADKVEGHFLRSMKQYAKLSGQERLY
jgi:hypothetical protein